MGSLYGGQQQGYPISLTPEQSSMLKSKTSEMNKNSGTQLQTRENQGQRFANGMAALTSVLNAPAAPASAAAAAAAPPTQAGPPPPETIVGQTGTQGPTGTLGATSATKGTPRRGRLETLLSSLGGAAEQLGG